MAKRKPTTRRRRLRPVTDAEIDAVIAEAATPPVMPAAPAGTGPLHDLFDQQVRAVLDASDLDEEQRQSILVAMACPCCGGGAGLLTYKLKPRK